MECNHRINDAMIQMEELESMVAERRPEMPTGNVPCNGCTLCCHADAVRLLPEDDISLYQTVPHSHFNGERMLAHKKNGDCIYLMESGCGVHDHKPLMCKEMDCRQLARKLKKKDLKRYNVHLGVWAKGRLMICRSRQPEDTRPLR